MTKPLAVIYYENLLLGSQVVNRFQDLGYRVQTAPALKTLVEQVGRDLPLVLVLEMTGSPAEACEAVSGVRALPATSHIPVIAIAGGKDKKLEERARKAGATLVARETALLDQLPSLLDQVLSLD